MALIPIANFIMNGTQVEKASAMPPMGALSSHVVCLVGTAPTKASAVPYNEAVRLDSYPHAMQMINPNSTYEGTLPAVVEYLMTRATVTLYVIIVEQGSSNGETLANIIGAATGEGISTGIHKIPECAEAPTIIYAPGFSDIPLGQKLALIGDKVKAFPLVDAPDTTKQAAAEFAGQFGGIDTPEEAVHVAFPSGLYKLNGSGETAIIPSGARLLAAMCGVEMWESPQSQLDGCENSIPVAYSPTDETSEHNFLNKHGVYTFCKSPTGGVTCTGNRAHSGTFTPSIGLDLAMARKLVETSEIYKGRMMTRPFVEAMVARLNSWIKTLKLDGCIIDARVDVSERNTADTYRSGSFYISLHKGGYSPLEHFHVTLADDVTIVEKYVKELTAL
ncbi:phage tail protein [Vibrio parahaemolyticus]